MFIGLSLSITGQLRSSASAYAIVGLDPAFVTDFGAEFYRKSGATSTFSDSITHSAASNATMVDSDGLLKWRPHNLLTYSEAVTNWQAFGHATVSVSDGVFTLVEAITTAGHSISQACSSSSQVDLVVDIKANGRTKGRLDAGTTSATYGANFDLVAETIDTAGSAITASSIVALSDGWYRLTIRSTDSNVFRIVIKDDTGAITYTGDGVSGFLFRYPHGYRSDLGGMVNNPDRGDSYVPTTTSAVYLPRRGHHVYNGDSWVNKGLLHESEQRVNLVTYSDQFNNTAYWSSASTFELLPFGSGSVVDATTAPDGTASADLIVPNTNNTPHALFTTTYTDTATKTFSVFLKAGGYTKARIQIGASAMSQGVYADVDLTSGTVGAATVAGGTYTAVASTIEAYGNGWFRASVSCVTPAGAHVGYISPTDNSGNRIFIGDGTSGVYIYGAQLEAGSTPSSYIPTSGATVTRSAETLTVPAANLPWPSPVVIGEELVTNGTFDTDVSGWSNGTGASSSWTSGEIFVTGGSQFGAYQQLSGLTVGVTYYLSGDGRVGTGTNVRLRITSDTTLTTTRAESNVVTATGGNEEMSLTFTAQETNPVVYLRTSGNGDTGYFDNISVKEIKPLSVSIQMQGEMTYADTNASSEVAPYQWYKDFNNRIQHYIPTSTGTGQPIFLQGSSGVFDSVSASATYYSPGVNVPFNIASRHGSTFINGAVDGTALTADTTPVALPDLSATDLQLGYNYMGTISLFRVWADDLTDAGIAEASAPSTVPSLSLTFDGASTSFTDSGMVV